MWLGLALLLAGCGHAVSPALDFDQAPRFAFREPDCPASTRPAEVGPDEVLVRYLGAGGLYVEWRGEALLAGPFFSNPDLMEVAFGRVRTRRGDVVRGLRGLRTGRVGAILVGHSHYDHLADVPFIAERFTRDARIYVNASGHTVLSEHAGLSGRVDCVEPVEKTETTEGCEPSAAPSGPAGSIRLRDAAGRPLPFRIHPLPSSHAPHLWKIHLMKGETEPRPREEWGRPRRYLGLKEGRPHAFVIDLLDPERPEAPPLFRIHYQDSASDGRREPNGIPPEHLLKAASGVGYDLAMTCMASANWVEGYPEAVLKKLEPRHVLITHYEDFFRPRDAPCRFVPALGQGVANGFLERTDCALRQGDQTLTRPVGEVCGATGPGWSMPRVGEWIVLRRSLQEGTRIEPR